MQDLKDMQAVEEARLRRRKLDAEGKQVGLGVISGRISEIERQSMEELGFIGRQMDRKQGQLESAYKLVDMLVGFEQMDFQNALSLYNTEFNNNMAMYKQLRGEYEYEKDFEQRLVERDQDMARANLEIYINAIVSGNMRWDEMSADQQAEIHKLEVKAGLGYGFLSKLKMPPGADIKSITTRTDQNGVMWADTIYINPDGSLRVESLEIGQSYVKPASGGSSGGRGGGTTKKSKYGYPAEWITPTMVSQANKYLSDNDSNGDYRLSKAALNRALEFFQRNSGLGAEEAKLVLMYAYQQGGYSELT
jgi:hypothetical protein